MKGILMLTLSTVLTSCLVLNPSPALDRGSTDGPYYVCEPLLIRYLDPVPQYADDALRNAIVYWGIGIGVTPFIQITQLETEEFEAILREYPVPIWIQVANHMAPLSGADTVIYGDSRGCVNAALIRISRTAMDQGLEQITELLIHELGQVLGLPYPDKVTPEEVAVLKAKTGGIAPLPWQQIPTIVDFLALQYIAKKRQTEGN